MAPGNWQLVKNFAIDIVRGLNVAEDKTRVAGIIYSNFAYLRFDFNSYNTRQGIINDINHWNHLNGYTNTTGAFMVYLNKLTAPDSGQRFGVQDVIILITDGNTTRSREGLIGNVSAVKALGAHVIGVGVGKIDLQEMSRIVSSPFSSNYFGVSEFSSLISVLDAVIQSANCLRSTPAPTPRPLPAGTQVFDFQRCLQPVKICRDNALREVFLWFQCQIFAQKKISL